jgi:hypothetical protein
MPRRIFGDVVKGVDVTNGANAASKSVLAAGKTSTGKQVPFSVGADGKLSLEVDAVTAANVGIDQSDPGVSNKVVAELSGSNLKEANVVNVATAGQRAQLPNIPCREITIIAKCTNTGVIYVGKNTVSSTVYGVELEAKDSFTFVVSNANELWIDASVDGEGISYVAI